MARSGSTRSGRGKQRTAKRLRGSDIGEEALEMVGSAGRSSRDATALSARYTGRGAGERPGRAQSSSSRGRRTSDIDAALDRGAAERVRRPSGSRGMQGVLTNSGDHSEITPGYDDDSEETMQRSRGKVAQDQNLSADQLMQDQDAFNRANGGDADQGEAGARVTRRTSGGRGARRTGSRKKTKKRSSKKAGRKAGTRGGGRSRGTTRSSRTTAGRGRTGKRTSKRKTTRKSAKKTSKKRGSKKTSKKTSKRGSSRRTGGKRSTSRR